jgi:hypothetical protein
MRSLNAMIVCGTLALACGSSGKSPRNWTDGGGGSGGDAGPADSIDAQAGCVQVTVPLLHPLPDVLIVQDRSASMNDGIDGQPCAGGCGASSKWSLLSMAIENLVMTSETSLNWGLKLFGGDGAGACGVSEGAEVQVGPSSASAIQGALTVTPGGDAPIEAAIKSAVAYLQGVDDANPKFILLATGGQPDCPPAGDAATDDSAGATQAIANALIAGFPTFVVGAASSSEGAATAALDQMALAGGKQQAGAPTSYYTLSDLAALTTSLNARVEPIPGCTLAARLGGGIPSVSVTQSTGTFELPEDPNNGWSYDAAMANIALNGSACEDLLNGDDTSITLSYNCGG